MHAEVLMPHITRSELGNKRFVKAAPNMVLRMFPDSAYEKELQRRGGTNGLNGLYDYFDKRDDDYAFSFGPDARRAIRELVPDTARRIGEDVHFHGIVGGKDAKGLGYVSPEKSAILTNILNGSQDFSPLLGPLYSYTDTEYDPENDPEGRGPRPTGEWIPRRDENGNVMYREDGKMVMRPVFPFMSMPIYNFSHPLWDEDPEKAWNMVNDYGSALDWLKWGNAPMFADSLGRTVMRNIRGVEDASPRDIDYYLTNMKRLAKPGWFEGFEGLDKGSAKGLLDSYKSSLRDKAAEDRQLASYVDAATKQTEADRAEQAASRHADWHFTPSETDGRSRGAMKDTYRAMIHNALSTPEIVKAFGLSEEDEAPMQDFLKRKGINKYNRIENDADKRFAVITDYLNEREAQESQGNIAGALKEKF